MERNEPNVSLVFTVTKDNGESGEEIHVPLDEVLSDLGIEGDARSVCIKVEQDGNALLAETCPHNRDFPYVSLDAMNADGDFFNVAMVELPNEDLPTSVSARLYAGLDSHEYDEPIAEVRHAMDVSALKARPGMKPPTKVVWVNDDVATSRNMSRNDNYFEHEEDVHD